MTIFSVVAHVEDVRVLGGHPRHCILYKCRGVGVGPPQRRAAIARGRYGIGLGLGLAIGGPSL